MSDVRRALEAAAEMIRPHEEYTGTEFDMAKWAVYEFLKAMPVFVGNDVNRGAVWNPAMLAAAVEKEPTP